MVFFQKVVTKTLGFYYLRHQWWNDGRYQGSAHLRSEGVSMVSVEQQVVNDLRNTE